MLCKVWCGVKIEDNGCYLVGLGKVPEVALPCGIRRAGDVEGPSSCAKQAEASC